MTTEDSDERCWPGRILSDFWAQVANCLCLTQTTESDASKGLQEPKGSGIGGLIPHIFYTRNQTRLGFDAEQSVPYTIRFNMHLQAPDRLILLAIIATAGHLLGKYNCVCISLFLVLFSAVCYRAGRRLQKRYFLQNCLRCLTNSDDARHAFLARIGAPTVQKLPQERAEWLNDLLSKCWPFINSLLQNQLDRRQPDLLSDMLGAGHGVWLERFTLGDRPPAVCYIHSEPVVASPDELTIELKVLYAGNCVLTLSRRTALLFKVRAGVRDVSLRANARLRLRPLISYPPFIGGCAFTLLDRPALDYEGVQLANLADNRLIKSLLVAQVVHPELLRRLKAPHPLGLCVFQVIEAENLQLAGRTNAFLSKPNDLFCIVRIGPMQFETPVVFDSLNPFWDCSHTSPVHDISEPIRVELFDRDALSADDYIGAIEFRVRDVALDRQLNGLDKWLPISRVASGALHFRCTFLRLRWTLSIRELRSAQRLLHSSALKFPLGVLSVYVYSIKLYESIIQSDSPPVLQLRHNGLSFESSPLVNWTDETIGRKKEENLQRSYPVEERFQFNLMDPWHEIVVLDVLDTTGFRPSDLAALRVFDERSYGRCTLSVKTLLERQARLLQSLRTQDRTNNTPGSSHLSASDHGLRLEFELFPKYYSNSNDRKPIGRIRLFARLSFVCVPPKVFQNLQRKPHIRADPFQPTSTMSFVRRLVMKPTHSLRHPIHTLRTLRPPDLPALLQITRTRVTDDRLKFDPPRTYQDSNECHVSLRFEWSEHKRLYVHVLGVTSPPKEAIKYGVKFYVRLILVALNISTSSTKTFDSKESLPIDSKIQDGSTSTALTRRSYLVKPTNLIPIGQRLTVELDPRRHIDSHRLTVQLLFKQHFTSIFCLRCYSNPTILIASGQLLVPSIAFRSEPIDRWIQLKRISQK